MGDNNLTFFSSNAYCSVPQCKGSARKSSNLRFYRFPRIRDNWNKPRKDRAMRLRREWIRVLKMGKKVTNSMVVCSDHFQPSDYQKHGGPRQTLKRDAIPSLKLPLSSVQSKERQMEAEQKKGQAEERFAAILQKREISIQEHISEEHASDEQMIEETVEEENVNLNISLDEQTAIEALWQLRYSDIVQSLKESKGIQVCSGDLNSKVHLRTDELTDKQLNSLSGVTSIKLLEYLCSKVESAVPGRHFLRTKDRIVMTLMKLKLNISFCVLAILFGCSASTCTTYFLEMTYKLSAIFSTSIYWPSKSEVVENMPKCFEHFQDVRVVLDCTEIPLEKPRCLRCQIMTYSTYKSGHTLRYCLGVSPGGLVTFVSRGYGGRATDKDIIYQSNILDRVEPYVDAVMVDKGFFIKDLCDMKGIKVVQPPYLRNKKSLSFNDAILTKNIAKSRVHVERAIQRIKIFKLLQVGKFPFRFLHSADRLMTIACGIVNLTNPILADDKYA